MKKKKNSSVNLRTALFTEGTSRQGESIIGNNNTKGDGDGVLPVWSWIVKGDLLIDHRLSLNFKLPGIFVMASAEN